MGFEQYVFWRLKIGAKSLPGFVVSEFDRTVEPVRVPTGFQVGPLVHFKMN